jgi:hypothetical protein
MLGSGEMASRERGDFSEVLASRKMVVGEKNGKRGHRRLLKRQADERCCTRVGSCARRGRGSAGTRLDA